MRRKRLQFEILTKDYDNTLPLLQREIERLCYEQHSSLISKKESFSFALLSALLVKDGISDDDKISMLINSLLNLDHEQTKQCFTLLEMTDYAVLLNGKRRKIIKDSISDQILPILNENGWITFEEETTDEGSYYRVFGKKLANG